MDPNDRSGVPRTVAMSATPAPSWTPAPGPPPERRGGGSGGIIAAVVALGCLGALGLGTVVAGGGAWFVISRQRAREQLRERVELEESYRQRDDLAGLLDRDPHSEERMAVPIPPGASGRGASEARVTIVELGDFQCPFCARADGTVGRVLAEHPEDVRLVWLDHPLPFHTAARTAARAAREARTQGGDARFWQMHDLLFARQVGMSRATILGLGAEIGLDPTRLALAVDGGSLYDGLIDADVALAERIGATGTPTFYVNGRPIVGAQPYDVFQRTVEEELAHARLFEAAGVPRSRLYEEITARGRTSPPPERARPSTHEEADPDRVYRVPVGASPAQGPADALVTLVVFSDFQCPFCARLAPTFARLRETYGADLRIVFKHNPLPFHDRAMPAALASMAVYDDAGPAAFFRMHDLLFENRTELDDDSLARFARRAGGSERRARAALARGASDAIDADMALARELGATGTPQSYVNGRSLRGAQPYEAFATLIDAELVRARALVAAGTPRARVYEVVLGGAR